jgi:hypothetical protein
MMKTKKYNKFFVETNFKKSRKFRIKTYLTIDKNKTRHIDSVKKLLLKTYFSSLSYRNGSLFIRPPCFLVDVFYL